MYQENTSVMPLERIERAYNGNKTKRIQVRYFLIKDQISSGDISIKYCPTGEMLVEHFTKQIQGALFRNFRAVIQGIPLDTPDMDLGWDRPEGTTIPSPQGWDEKLQKRYQ